MRSDRETASRLLDGARKRGADFAEVFIRSGKKLTVEERGQAPEAVESSRHFGYALRVIRDKRLGFSYSTDSREAESVLENAVEASRWTERDDYLGLPEPGAKESPEIFDDEAASISEEDAVARALLLEKAAFDVDKRITKTRKPAVSFSRSEVVIMNSRGVDDAYSSTSVTAQIMVVAEEDGDSQSGWDFDGNRFLGEVSFEAVGRGAAERALRMLGARKIASAKVPVILDNSVAAEFLGIFSSLLSSEAVQKGKSLLAGKMGQRVVSPVISIVDDGQMPRKLGSRPFDDEGVAILRKDLIRDGVLTGYLYNSHTANRGGVRSTGNAVRAGLSSIPGVGPSNLSIAVSPRHIQRGKLFPLVERGLYITDAMGVHTANPISGEFSIGVSGLWIEHGIVRYPVKEAVVSGNILDFFGKVEAAGDDLRFYGGIGAPSLLIGPTDVSA